MESADTDEQHDSNEKEGVIKYKLHFTKKGPLSEEEVRPLTAWRHVMRLLGMVGQTPSRYDGLGFGNMSYRSTNAAGGSREQFVITGTQTGIIQWTTGAHYSVVHRCEPSANLVVASGAIMPSSECMTHWVIYAADQSCNFIIHAHNRDIWNHARALRVPITNEKVEYGTPEMSAEVTRLFNEDQQMLLPHDHVRDCRIFSMGGHQDGIFCFGPTPESASNCLIEYFAKALAVNLTY